MDQLSLHTTIDSNKGDLISRYLNRDEALKEFYSFPPNLTGLEDAANSRKDFPIDRTLLVSVLAKQAAQSNYSSELTASQIDRLSSEDVFTVTTGHQCCLFGGPMYFVYKILSVIKLAQTAQDNGINAVPIFWMATEDHDFEEINHCWIHDNKLVWKSNQTGAVGRFDLSELESTIGDLKGQFKYQESKQKLISEIQNIYNSTKTLSEATRDLCYYLFSDLGIVVLDADDAQLKAVFNSSIKKELQESISFEPVTETSLKLKSMKLTTQVNPREINLFWMKDGERVRIERTETGFKSADDKLEWNTDQLLSMVDTEPNSFSPNVILRPVYQEQILPNLAYVGGPGELSYALQLKTMFKSHGTFFPMLVLRDMALIIETTTVQKLDKLGVSLEDFKKDYHELENKIARNHGSHESLVDNPEKTIEQLLEKIQDDLKGFDQTLAQSAETEKKRIIKRLEVLKKKVLKADKRQHQAELEKLRTVADEIFPDGTPQERKVNWLSFFHSKDTWVNTMLDSFDPFEGTMKVFSAKD